MRSELKAEELVNLPVSINRNYQYLFRVLPGFTPPAEAHSVPSNPSRALVFNVNGASRSSNNIRIDGVSTTNIWLPHVAAYVPALESLETVNVVTNSFDAEQGLAGGSAINVQIKSGTNTLHGSAFEYHTNEGLRTRNYFAPPGTPKGEWRVQPVRRHARRPGRAQPLLLFRELRGHARPQGPEPDAVGADRSRAARRSRACRRCPSTIPFTGDNNGARPHRVREQPDPAGPLRPDRAPAAVAAAAAQPAATPTARCRRPTTTSSRRRSSSTGTRSTPR